MINRNLWKVSLTCFLVLILAPCFAMAIEPDAYEDDDEFNKAKLIIVGGEAQHHNFHDEGDADWVMFFTEPDNTYRIEVFNVKDKCDIVLELYNFTDYNTLIKSIDNGRPGEGEFYECCKKQGLYLLKIKQYIDPNKPDISCEGTEYDIKVSLTTAGAGRWINFIISDNKENRIPNARIEIENSNISYCGHSLDGCWNGEYFYDLTGRYFLHLDDGDYTLTAEIEGYNKYEENFKVDNNFASSAKNIAMENINGKFPTANTNCKDISDLIQ